MSRHRVPADLGGALAEDADTMIEPLITSL